MDYLATHIFVANNYKWLYQLQASSCQNLGPSKPRVKSVATYSPSYKVESVDWEMTFCSWLALVVTVSCFATSTEVLSLPNETYVYPAAVFNATQQVCSQENIYDWGLSVE